MYRIKSITNYGKINNPIALLHFSSLFNIVLHKRTDHIAALNQLLPYEPHTLQKSIIRYLCIASGHKIISDCELRRLKYYSWKNFVLITKKRRQLRYVETEKMKQSHILLIQQYMRRVVVVSTFESSFLVTHRRIPLIAQAAASCKKSIVQPRFGIY